MLGASLGRPNSLRPSELPLPRDAQTALCGRGLGGKPVSPALNFGAQPMHLVVGSAGHAGRYALAELSNHFPVRGVELGILFAGLALTGAGRYALSARRALTPSLVSE